MPKGPSWLCVPALGLVLSLICSPPPVASKLVNRTIDDEKGDSVTGVQPVYAPDNLNWIQGTTCVHCNFLPGKVIDVNATFDGTWHDGTYTASGPPLTISASFSGVAVYVFNIIANNFGGITTFTNLTFYIDNELVGSYIHTPTSDANILYRVPVYTNTSLANQEHFLRIVNGGGPDPVRLG